MATMISVLALVTSIAAAAFVWTQTRLLRSQNQMQALLELDSRWDSDRMQDLRHRWAEDELRSRLSEEDRDLVSLETLMEFLETFATLEEQRILDAELVWDSTIGWHAVRYYFYNNENGNIGRLRDKWLDSTLYQNLGFLWGRYIKVETKVRGIVEGELVKQIRDTKVKFLEAEQNATRVPERSD
jgi:hypothetical protein